MNLRRYYSNNKINPEDANKLINKVLDFKKQYNNFYICGTSIFRNLSDDEKNAFLTNFKEKTGIEFKIISSEKENELTVMGATRCVNTRVCVFVGGGGSTEISIYDKKIIKSENIPIGVMDIMNKFPDLANDIAAPILEDIETRIQETRRFFEKISLDEIRSRVQNPDWWYATRAMCAFVLVVSKHIEAKYVVPTNIAMVYGLINDKK